MSRCGVFGTEAVATTDNLGGVLFAIECLFNVEVEGIAVSTGLFCAVENCDTFCSSGNSGEQVAYGEGAIQVNAYQTDFLTFGSEVVDSLADSLCDGAHSDDYSICVGSTIVVK